MKESLWNKIVGKLPKPEGAFSKIVRDVAVNQRQQSLEAKREQSRRKRVGEKKIADAKSIVANISKVSKIGRFLQEAEREFKKYLPTETRHWLEVNGLRHHDDSHDAERYWDREFEYTQITQLRWVTDPQNKPGEYYIPTYSVSVVLSSADTVTITGLKSRILTPDEWTREDLVREALENALRHPNSDTNKPPLPNPYA